MTNSTAKSRAMATALRKAVSNRCVAMPGVFNAGAGKLVEKAGFEAVYVSGAGLANAVGGMPDVGVLGREEVAILAGFVARAVKIPVIVDADTGWGNCGATVKRFVRAGIAGMQIEDQVEAKKCGHLGGKKLVSAAAMVGRIRSAVKGRGKGNFVIVGRTDARGVEGFEKAVERAKKYVAAGADVIFPEALETEAEFAEFAKRVKAPLLANMTEFGKSPLLGVKRLEQMGYRLVIFPQTAFRVGMKAMETALAELFVKGTQAGMLGKMQTRAELYDLLDYRP